MKSANLEESEQLSLVQKLTTVRVNPVNNKCLTIPLLRLDNPYSINFHLSWLGFAVAFLSWFAFSPLIPEAVRTDLNLTQKQIGNSNIVSLCATLIMRVVVGYLVDRFGPRRVMAGLLLVGAIPSGLAGTVNSAEGLYVIRFFIGILGATFVPCQVWTTTFFDTSVVGRANALVGGWGNSGGGFTFIIMVALYNRLREDHISAHSAWRAAFAIVPVPVLITVAIVTLIFGTDHPDGKWSEREGSSGNKSLSDPEASSGTYEGADSGHAGEKARRSVSLGEESGKQSDTLPELKGSDVNVGHTLAALYSVAANPVTWLPALAYLTSFGFELAMDANLSNVLFGLYHPTNSSFGQTTSGYIASIYGMLNIFTRPFGGYLGDLIYKKYGVRGKKYLVLITGLVQGVLSVGLGVYIDHGRSASSPPLAGVVVLMVFLATINEIANGANFSLVPHCNPGTNGFMTGIVGAMGNLGGICFALLWRYQPAPFGKAFWIAGIVTIVREDCCHIVIRRLTDRTGDKPGSGRHPSATKTTSITSLYIARSEQVKRLGFVTLPYNKYSPIDKSSLFTT
ncbi:nitrate transporter [Trametopsis cervina]|nr:nitrate transporter [Trametopsis cervina]